MMSTIIWRYERLNKKVFCLSIPGKVFDWHQVITLQDENKHKFFLAAYLKMINSRY